MRLNEKKKTRTENIIRTVQESWGANSWLFYYLCVLRKTILWKGETWGCKQIQGLHGIRIWKSVS